MTLLAAALLASTLSLPAPSFTADRVAFYAAAAADVITTELALHRGHREGNPLLTPIIGEHPRLLTVVAIKAGAIGLVEAVAAWHRRHGRYGWARAMYRLGTVLWVAAAAANLRFAFR